MEKLSKELLLYGEYVDDVEVETKERNFIRNRIIKYNGKTYIHKMVNGEIIEIREI